MNIDQLKFALEIAKTKSINKAAENLFVSQPNLSRSIKTLEAEIGLKIFSRGRNGVEVTIGGNDFLAHAATIVDEIDKINHIAHPTEVVDKFSVSVPKGSYISHAFTSFLSKLDRNKAISIDYKECGSIGAIENILAHGFNLGIIRYEADQEALFHMFLEESGLYGREIREFEYCIAFSSKSPLACKEALTVEDFYGYIELIHGDSYFPNAKKESDQIGYIKTDKVIRIYDSMGQLAMLREVPESFMAVLPLDETILQNYGLVQRKVEGFSKKFKDVLIFKKHYAASNLDKLFVDELEKSVR